MKFVMKFYRQTLGKISTNYRKSDNWMSMRNMEIFNQLSSAQSDKTEKSNRIAADKCIKNPKLLNDIATGFLSADKKLQSDCIEVFTMVSENHPDLIVPLADKILPLLKNKETKTRWEAVHTLSFIADKIPEIICSILPDLQELIKKDKSAIVRDYTVDTVANFAKFDKDSSEKAFGILKMALDLWNEKHTKQVFQGFSNILDNKPAYKTDIGKITRPYLDAKKKVVVKEAKKIIKRIEKQG
ncbi:MAG TPA: hypothetical protein ENO18_06760 [Caldithrix sp.]|nr:hypothetical protein [Caldithrix sp.]